MIPCFTTSGVIDLDAPDWRAINLSKVSLWMGAKQRWNGHLSRPVSVGEHSLVVASRVPHQLRLSALLHDAHEYLIGDVLRPVERYLRAVPDVEPRIGMLRVRIDGAMARAAFAACGIAPAEWLGLVTCAARGIYRREVQDADDAACAFEQTYCAPALTDWPEDALYARAVPDPGAVAEAWLHAVREAVADLLAGEGVP